MSRWAVGLSASSCYPQKTAYTFAMAERLGYHRTFLGSVERGERNLSVLNILTFATALGIDPGELVSGMSRGPADEARGTV